MYFRLPWLFLLALVACDRGEAHSPGAAEKAEERTESVTVWGDRFEVFLEHRPIVVGQPARFAAHITDMKTLEPRRKDPVTFVLTQGSETPIRHEEPAPKSPGIYQPEVVFPKPGDWKVALEIGIDGTTSTVTLPSFRAYATKEEAEKSPEQAAPEGMGFTKEQQWKVLTKTDPAAKRRLVERLRVPAVVAARPGSRAAVTPPLSGRLLRSGDKPFPALGERVEAGQTLAVVQPPFSDFAAKMVEANAESIRAKLMLDQATLAQARIKKLADGGAKTEREVQESEFSVKTAQAAHEAALSLKSTYEKAGVVVVDRGAPILELKAPIAGVITQVAASIGEYVSAEKAVFMILDPAKVFIEARIPESDLGRLGTKKAALYELVSARGTLVDLGERSRLVHVGSEVDPATRSVPLFYEVENPEGHLRIGMTVTLHLETSRSEEAIAVPVSALVDEDARPVLFVQASGETFQKRSLKLGIRDGDWVQVLEGVSEGERVVTKEAFAIRLASVSSVIPAHGHAH
jgi:RND family efflux transporter MFP subunit